MALITIAGSMSAGSTTPLTIDTTELATLPSDAYFQDQDNWLRVRVDYRSTNGNQRSATDVTGGSGTFTVSAKARQEVWSVNKIVIYDYDGGSYTLNNADITDVSNYNITITA